MSRSVFDFDWVLSILAENYYSTKAPSVTLISQTEKTPYHILVSTMISLRTKDQVTLDASRRLFKVCNDLEMLSRTDVDAIASLIYPAGFYRTKARNLSKISRIIIDQYDSVIPDEIDELVKLPGVGRKTANLVRILGYNKDGICVDTHVHRISNRLGWTDTKTPEKTEFALRELLPIEIWRDINDYLVSYGQMVCKPVSPHCSECKLNEVCLKKNVKKSR